MLAQIAAPDVRTVHLLPKLWGRTNAYIACVARAVVIVCDLATASEVHQYRLEFGDIGQSWVLHGGARLLATTNGSLVLFDLENLDDTLNLTLFKVALPAGESYIFDV